MYNYIPFSTKTTFLRDVVIEKLSTGPSRVSEMVTEISTERKVTIQAVYKVLRALKKEEIITIHRRIASLSIIWLQSEIDKLSATKKAYTLNTYIEELKNSNKGHVSFTFNSLHELDLFWTHAFIIVEESTPPEVPAYILIPHDWFFYSRVKTDRAWMKELMSHKRSSRMLVTHSTLLDRKTSQERKKIMKNNLELMFNKNPLQQQEFIYYNILGPWVFLGKIDKSVSAKIAQFMEKYNNIDLKKEEHEELLSIINERGKFSLVIYNSPKKSSVLIRKLLKYFE